MGRGRCNEGAFQIEWQPRVSPHLSALSEAHWWWITIKEEVQTVFRKSLGGASEGRGGLVVLWLSWSESRPIKLLKHGHAANLSLPFSPLAILPICPTTVGVLFERCDKTGRLYISADIFKLVFSQTCAAHRDWERHLSALLSPTKTVVLFSARWHTERLFMHLCTQGHTSQMTSGLPQDVRCLSVCNAVSSLLKESGYLESQ